MPYLFILPVMPEDARLGFFIMGFSKLIVVITLKPQDFDQCGLNNTPSIPWKLVIQVVVSQYLTTPAKQNPLNNEYSFGK